MLKMRIRELGTYCNGSCRRGEGSFQCKDANGFAERQVAEMNATPASVPATPSNLTAPPLEAGSAGGSSEEDRKSGEEEKRED